MEIKKKYQIALAGGTLILLLVVWIQNILINKNYRDLRTRVSSISAGVDRFDHQIRNIDEIKEQFDEIRVALTKIKDYKAPEGSVSASVEGWQHPQNWGRVEEGMTRDEVTAILGPPTSHEKRVTGVQISFYEGETDEYGLIMGQVQYKNGKVFKVIRKGF